ncbi:MAG: hypothetical protein KatS3mg060_3725 [Dehalococcoidia bacterium]|nr:MAG: hypothetical protein KatS3mg060_3725 [Dehalococcoidia bacterium]
MQPSYYPPRPTKQRGVALVLEVIPGLFGLFGIGWLYAANTGVGLALVLGSILAWCVALAFVVFTGGIGLFCTVPAYLACLLASALLLNSYASSHRELFVD